MIKCKNCKFFKIEIHVCGDRELCEDYKKEYDFGYCNNENISDLVCADLYDGVLFNKNYKCFYGQLK